jgi:S-adenosylmethionine synthetase
MTMASVYAVFTRWNQQVLLPATKESSQCCTRKLDQQRSRQRYNVTNDVNTQIDIVYTRESMPSTIERLVSPDRRSATQ